jgi:hypothetical protein
VEFHFHEVPLTSVYIVMGTFILNVQQRAANASFVVTVKI